jgi:hypothetical protein
MRTNTVLAALAIGAAAIGISVAPPAAADPSNNCQDNSGVTVCGQGGVSGGGQSVAPAVPPVGGGCTTPYGSYQNCKAGS